MLKILAGLSLALLFFVVLFFRKLREALGAGGVAVLVAIIVGLSGVSVWMGFSDSARQKAGPMAGIGVKDGAAPAAAEAPAQDVGVPDPSDPARVQGGNSAQGIKEIYEKVSPSVVVVYNIHESGRIRGHGTGFFIDPWGMVVTNYHVVEGASSVRIGTKNGTTMEVRGVAAADAENDVVILAVNLPLDSVRTLKMAPSIPQVGEKIAVIGTPHHPQLAQTVTDGIVSAIRPVAGGKRLIQISAPISPGSSGSPVVNMNGDVVGIATRVHRQSSYIGIAVPGEVIAGLSGSAAAPFSVSRLPVLYAGQGAGPDPTMQPGEGQRRLDEERRRGLEEQARVQEEKRKWHQQQVEEASDLLDKAKHNLSFDRYELAFGQYEKALQIFRGAGETQGMAFCLQRMGYIQKKLGRHDVASEYLRQADAVRAQR